mgnify:CR=1 FL=1
MLLVYPEGSAERLPTGAGFVVPRGEAPMVACGLVSGGLAGPGVRIARRRFDARWAGPARRIVLDADDQDIVRACTKHLAALLPLPGRPTASAVIRWPRRRSSLPAGTPRAGRPHPPTSAARVSSVSGQAYDGIDVAGCVRGAAEAAEAARNFVDATRRERTA